MARGTRTVSTFQPPEESWNVQRPKRCDKHGDEDEDNSPKNLNDVHIVCHLWDVMPHASS